MKEKKKGRMRLTGGEITFTVINSIFLILLVFVILYPLLYMLAASLSDPLEVARGAVSVWPKGFTLEAYEWILSYNNVLNSYRNTILYTTVGTAINMVMTTMCAYPLSKRNLKGRGVVTFMITVTMLFSGGMIPTYLVIKSLGMVNTMWALVIPASIGTWNMFVMKNYFQTSIPTELLDAAYIDGASEWSTLFRIVLPLSKPILAVMFITFASGHWNSYFAAKIYITDYRKYPYQLVLTNLLSAVNLDGNSMGANSMGAETSSLTSLRMMLESMKYSGCIISAVPILLIFPFVEKYFEKGIMLGAIKG